MNQGPISSYWEKSALSQTDICIIGAGIIGLSTAISAALAFPDKRIVVLERGPRTMGATTRNAGFACFGSASELLQDIEVLGEDKALAIAQQRIKGLHILRNRFSDDHIKYEMHGGYEIIREKEMHVLDSLDSLNKQMSQITGIESTYTVLNRREHRRLGFGQSVQAVIYNPLEGQIHSGYLIQAMESKAQSLGIRIEYGSNVLEIKENPKVMEITIQTLLGKYSMISKETIVCTNAWISALVPQIDIQPGRGQIIVTSPIENLSFIGAFHADEGYYYFRNIGKRVLLGGGRNLDFEGESTHEFASTEIIQHALLKMLQEDILPGKSFTIEYNWSGIMGFSKNKQSIVQRVSPHCIIAFGCNGMGIALGSLIGEQVIEFLS